MTFPGSYGKIKFMFQSTNQNKKRHMDPEMIQQYLVWSRNIQLQRYSCKTLSLTFQSSSGDILYNMIYHYKLWSWIVLNISQFWGGLGDSKITSAGDHQSCLPTWVSNFHPCNFRGYPCLNQVLVSVDLGEGALSAGFLSWFSPWGGKKKLVILIGKYRKPWCLDFQGYHILRLRSWSTGSHHLKASFPGAKSDTCMCLKMRYIPHYSHILSFTRKNADKLY